VLRALNRIAWLFAVLGGGCASSIGALTVASIAGRALASAPVPGDVELTQLGLALSISLCLPWCQLHGANIIVEFFTRGSREGTRRRLDALGALAIAAMTALLAWRSGVGAAAIAASGETTPILGLPQWWTYALLTPGLALAAVVALAQAGLLAAGRDPRELRS
jgi:TRAP-type C4-dicarboxylate transport system permease small subunit